MRTFFSSACGSRLVHRDEGVEISLRERGYYTANGEVGPTRGATRAFDGQAPGLPISDLSTPTPQPNPELLSKFGLVLRRAFGPHHPAHAACREYRFSTSRRTARIITAPERQEGVGNAIMSVNYPRKAAANIKSPLIAWFALVAASGRIGANRSWHRAKSEDPGVELRNWGKQTIVGRSRALRRNPSRGMPLLEQVRSADSRPNRRGSYAGSGCPCPV
jgi:hypothetical protein